VYHFTNHLTIDNHCDIMIHMAFKHVSDFQLKDIIASSINWNESMRKCGRYCGGACLQNFQVRVKKLGYDTSHFLGKASHTGFRHTGKARKKSWKEVLINGKHLQRERCQRFRRAYREYCNENGITIQCIECGNTGEWRGKSLRLQINHKDEVRSNNIPSNLEWICPNCHDVKTVY